MKKKTSKKAKTSKKTGKKSTKAKASSKRTQSARGKRIEFSYHAPEASVVAVAGSFCGWDDPVQLEKDDSGRWRTTVMLPTGDYEYRFLVDGEWRDDPACSEKTPNQFGSENCILHV